MARNSDAHLLRHSRILNHLRKKWSRAVAEKANDNFINLLEAEMETHERALTSPTEQPTVRLEKRW